MNSEYILDVVRDFINKKAPEKFVPGETYVRTSGASWNADDVASIVEVALGRWYVDGAHAYEFEKFLANATLQRYAILCNSGSSANLLAISTLMSNRLKDRAIKKGDEVITVACGFPTTVNPIIQNGLVPVFIDTNIPGYNALPHSVSEAITPKTKAIFMAHTLGNPYRAKEIRELADQNGLWVVADCCDALGAEHYSKPVPAWADISTFSFYPAHHISMGEGGAVTTDSSLLNSIIRSFRDWGRSCFPAGTLVDTDRGVVPIEKIRVAQDNVRTHTGKYTDVRQTSVRKYSGKLYTIKSSMRPKISVTEEHPFFVCRNGEYLWVLAKDLQCKKDIFLEAIPQYGRYNSTRPIHFSYKTLYQTKEEEIVPSKELARLIGYWLAEGSLAKGLKGKSGYIENKYYSYRVDFAFHKDEIEYIEDVKELMRKCFGIAGNVRTHGKSNGVSVCFKTRKGYEFFKQMFGTGAANKSLPEFIFRWSDDLCLELIKGYWRGDGSSSFQGFNVSSTSTILINQVREMLLRVGILTSSYKRGIGVHKPSVINGKNVVAKNDLHSLSIYGKNAEKLGVFLGEPYKARTNHAFSWISNNYAHYPIRSIVVSEVSDIDVYNLETSSEEHSYHVNGIAVHNCWCAPGKDNTCGKRFDWKLGDLPQGFDHKYIYSEIGYNLKATDLQAAVGLSQIKRLSAFVETRQNNWQFYRDELNKWKDYLILPERSSHSSPSWFGFTISIKENAGFSRNEFVSFLETNKIGTRMLFAGNLTRHPAYKDVKYRVSGTLHKSDFVMNSGMWIGVAPIITRPMQEYVVEKIGEFMESHS